MNFNFISQKENAIAVTEQLMKHLKARVTVTSIQRRFDEHPHSPSFLTMSDSLTEWGIESRSYQIDKTAFDKDDLYYPFIAHLKEEGGRFVLIESIAEGMVVLSDEKKKRTKITESNFLKRWSGYALHAEVNQQSGEPKYLQSKFEEVLRLVMMPICVILVATILYLVFENQVVNWSILTLSLLKFTGIVVCVLLLVQSINSNNPFIKNLCNLTGKNDCNAILKSDAAKLNSWLSWSEIGFFYFAGSFMALLFTSSAFPLLAWMNLFALPYTIYSLTYQFKHRNWCVLCCIVQALLCGEAIAFVVAKNYQLSIVNFPLKTFLLLAVAFLIPIIIWSFLKPFFVDSSQIKALKAQLKKFKYNSELFNQALKTQPSYLVHDELMPIVLGNPIAETTITMVSNPFCGPCAKAHEILDQLLRTRGDIKIKIIFTTSSHDIERTKVSKHFWALSLLKDEQLLKNALNDWYLQGEKKYEMWAKKYPVELDEQIDIIITKQKEWCDIAEISFTPFILINGYKLPDPYRLEDIKYLLD